MDDGIAGDLFVTLPRQRLRLPMGQAEGEGAATRHLCAGTYIDRTFRDRVIREVYNARNRRVAPSYGYDLIPVLRHAWRAWSIDFWQGVAAIAAYATFVVVPVVLIAAVALLLLLYSVVRVLDNYSRYYGFRGSDLHPQQYRSRQRTFKVLLGGSFLALLASFFIATSGQWPQLTRGLAPRSLLAAAASVPVFLLAVGGGGAVLRQLALNRLTVGREPSPIARSRRLRTVAAQQGHAFTVHSGFTPFIGSGVEVRTWSFAQRLVQGKARPETDARFDAAPFSTAQLVKHLSTMINGLRSDVHPETRLPGLTVADRVFLEGTYAPAYNHVLAGHPDGGVIEEIMTNPRETARHYLACQVSSWGGEIVTTVFVHVSLQGRTLYVEFSTYALPPTPPAFHVVDEVGGTGSGAVIRSLGKSVTDLPATLLAAPLTVLRAPVYLAGAVRARQDGTQRVRRGVNIGANVTAREAIAREADGSYFQFRDVLRHSKIIERRLLASIAEFLHVNGVDTSEFLARATTILNMGVMNSGPGTINLIGSAVGEDSAVGASAGETG